MIFTKNKEGIWAIRAMKYKKDVAGKYTRTCAPLAGKYTNRIFESKIAQQEKICLPCKSSRTEIQTYKVEERTFGTPCRAFSITCTATMQINCNKRKRLHKKRVQLPQDWFGTPTWPPFHCFGTPIWLAWCHVKTFYTKHDCFYSDKRLVWISLGRCKVEA